MERVEEAYAAVEVGKRAYGAYSWMILSASAILGVFGGVLHLREDLASEWYF